MNAVIAFPNTNQTVKPQPEHKEVHVADLDNGYLRIANELFDAVLSAPITDRQRRVLLAVIRKTYGFNKPMDWISNAQLAETCGLEKNNCSTAKNALLRMNVLRQKGRQIGVNKVLSEWDFSERCNKQNTAVAKNSKGCQNSESFAKSAKESQNSESFAKSAKKTFAKSTTTKDKKNNKEISPLTPQGEAAVAAGLSSSPEVDFAQQPKPTAAGRSQPVPCQAQAAKPEQPARRAKFDPQAVELPAWLPGQTWAQWVEYRKQLKKPLVASTVTAQFKQLANWQAQGHCVVTIIEQSIANGWTGLFAPKNHWAAPVSSHDDLSWAEGLEV